MGTAVSNLCRANLVVEWVYGNFLSAADSPRHMAKLQLNREAFTAVQAHKQLIQALQNQAKFDFPADMYKLLLSDLLQSRQIYQQLKLQYSIPKAPAAAGEQVATAVAAEAAENSIPTWPEALPVEVSGHAVLWSAFHAVCCLLQQAPVPVCWLLVSEACPASAVKCVVPGVCDPQSRIQSM